MTDQTLILALSPDVRAASRGDRAAFKRIVDATSRTVSSIALAILRDVDASEDVAQDVFLAAWRDLSKLRNPASFLPWIRQLTRNRSHHVLRSTVRFRNRIVADATGELVAVTADTSPHALDAMISGDERRALYEAISELPEMSREVVVLFYREGRSARQVADLLGMTESAVKQRLSRARATLRASLLERMGETLSRTAPAGAFSAVIIAAIAIAAPASAAAAVIGGGKLAAGKVAAAGGAALGGGLLGAAAGMTGGVWALLIGSRHMLRMARDDEERRGIRGFTLLNLGATLMFGATAVAYPDIRALTAAFVVMLIAFAYSYFVWVPRIVSRRYAAEVTENPSAEGVHRRQRTHAVLGFTVGALLGAGALVFGWLVSR